MSANMDTVGTPALHKVLSKHKMITCPAKHYLRNNVAKFKKGEKNILWPTKVISLAKSSGTTNDKSKYSRHCNRKFKCKSGRFCI